MKEFNLDAALNGGYIVQDCENSRLHFASEIRKDIEWSIEV